MSFDAGINFRDSAGFVTDGANETYCLKTDVYPTSRGGFTFGWDVADGSLDSRDRAVIDRRLSGINFTQAATHFFRLDLPATGTYDVHCAIGDQGNSQTSDWLIQDNATLIIRINTATNADTFDDATNVNLSEANWPSQELATRYTFTSTQLILQSNITGVNVIAHLRIVSVNNPASAPPPLQIITGLSVNSMFLGL